MAMAVKVMAMAVKVLAMAIKVMAIICQIHIFAHPFLTETVLCDYENVFFIF
jgi:hypothetical protein